MPHDASITLAQSSARGQVELIANEQHLQRVVINGMLKASVSLDIATADFKAMLVPDAGGRSAPSVIVCLTRLAQRGVEARLLHAGVPSQPALEQLKTLTGSDVADQRLTIRRCPRVHMKIVIVDCRVMYLGSANLTGAGLGAKGSDKRNFEAGIWTTSPDMIDGVLEHFNSVWEGNHCETCRRRDVCPVPLEEPDLRMRP